MISAWWLLVAFVGGSYAGVFFMALMQMARDLPEQSDACPRGWIGNDANHLSQADNEGRQFESQNFEGRGRQAC